MLIKYGEVNNQQKYINNFADYQDVIVSVNRRTAKIISNLVFILSLPN